MPAEFYVRFDDPEDHGKRTAEIVTALERLPTFTFRSEGEIWLRGTEEDAAKRWPYDVRSSFVLDSFCSRLVQNLKASSET
jgi:hypothetical protein